MKCSKCGSEIAPGQSFCTICGTPVNQVKNEVRQEVKKKVRNQNLGGQGFPPPPPPRKKSGVPVWAFILTILLVIVIMVGIFFIINTLSDSDDSSSTSSSRKKNDDNEENEDNNSKNNGFDNYTNNTTNNTVTPSGNGSGSTYKVPVDNFTVKVPDKYVYEVNSSTGTTSIGDESGTWIAHMAIKEKAYSTMDSKSFASFFTQKGYSVDKQEERTINGTQVYVLEVSSTAGEKEIFAIVRINSMYTAAIEIVNKDYTKLNYDALNIAVSIVQTAEKSSTTKNLETDNTFDLTKLVE